MKLLEPLVINGMRVENRIVLPANEGGYGYEVLRGTNHGPLLHYISVRGVTPYYVDTRVLGGNTYSYCADGMQVPR